VTEKRARHPKTLSAMDDKKRGRAGRIATAFVRGGVGRGVGRSIRAPACVRAWRAFSTMPAQQE
jgi:hypothetical protein